MRILLPWNYVRRTVGSIRGGVGKASLERRSLGGAVRSEEFGVRIDSELAESLVCVRVFVRLHATSDEYAGFERRVHREHHRVEHVVSAFRVEPDLSEFAYRARQVHYLFEQMLVGVFVYVERGLVHESEKRRD